MSTVTKMRDTINFFCCCHLFRYNIDKSNTGNLSQKQLRTKMPVLWQKFVLKEQWKYRFWRRKDFDSFRFQQLSEHCATFAIIILPLCRIFLHPDSPSCKSVIKRSIIGDADARPGYDFSTCSISPFVCGENTTEPPLAP